MPFKPKLPEFDLSRLESWLVSSKIQTTNNALYQVIKVLIDTTKKLETIVTVSSGSSGSSSNGSQTFLTTTDEIATLPNARRLLAGLNVTFDDTVPGERTVNGSESNKSIVYVIDGGGAEITTGLKGTIQVPFDCTILGWTLLADQVGDIELDILKDNPSSDYPPVTSIVASAPPELVSGDWDQDITLTGWTTSISKDDVLGFEVISVLDIERVTIQLEVQI